MTVKDIRSFEERYKGSGEEEEDLKRAYLQHEGDMDHIMEEVCGDSVPQPQCVWTELLPVISVCGLSSPSHGVS